MTLSIRVHTLSRVAADSLSELRNRINQDSESSSISARQLGSAGKMRSVLSRLETDRPGRAATTTRRIHILIGPRSMRREIDDMNRYLVSRSEALGGFTNVNWHTVAKEAANLRHFALWLLTSWNASLSNGCYLDFGAKLRADRPTYAYLAYLKDLPDLAASTKNHRIATVRSFYKYLDRTGRLPPNAKGRYQIESSANLYFESSRGLRLTKNVRTSDLRIPNSTSPTSVMLAGRVMDDGAVRPLSSAEIPIVLGVILRMDNPILRLCAYLALNSGARLQTLLTLRRCHARQMQEHMDQPHTLFPLHIGGDSLAKAKRGTAHTLQVPSHTSTMLFPYTDVLGNERSIAELLAMYEKSDHAQTRYELANKLRADHEATLVSPDHEHLFLGRNGVPFYLDDADPLNLLRRSPRVGGSFKTSFSLTLNPKIKLKAAVARLEELAEEGVGIHDLRGTFAEQSLLRFINLFIANGHDRFRAEEMAIRRVQMLLGHSSSTTTYRYLKFRSERAQLFKTNNAYAEKILGGLS